MRKAVLLGSSAALAAAALVATSTNAMASDWRWFDGPSLSGSTLYEPAGTRYKDGGEGQIYEADNFTFYSKITLGAAYTEGTTSISIYQAGGSLEPVSFYWYFRLNPGDQTALRVSVTDKGTTGGGGGMIAPSAAATLADAAGRSSSHLQQDGVLVASAKLLATDGDQRYWTAPATDGGRCLVATDQSGYTHTSCAPVNAMAAHGLTLGLSDGKESRTAYLAPAALRKDSALTAQGFIKNTDSLYIKNGATHGRTVSATTVNGRNVTIGLPGGK